MIIKRVECIELTVATCVSTENVIMLNSGEKTLLNDKTEAEQSFCLIV